jgi:predicted O-methyltransferase YrrM
MFEPAVQNVMDQVDRLRHEVDDHWQIPRAEAELLAQLVRLGNCRSIAEVGTSYGYSTLHLAAAAAENAGHVYAAERDPRKVELTRQHLKQADLADYATIYQGTGQAVLAALEPAEPIDFLFLDAVKRECFEYLDAAWPLLAPRAAIATDNALTHAEELASFITHLRALRGVHSTTIAVGNGLELSLRRIEEGARES